MTYRTRCSKARTLLVTGTLCLFAAATHAEGQVSELATGAPAGAGRLESIKATRIESSAAVSFDANNSNTTNKKRTLIRDVDAPTMQPFRTGGTFMQTNVNTQTLVTTVPAGKRLVLEDFSWAAGNTAPAEVVFVVLRIGETGPFVAFLPVAPAHEAATLGLTLQDGARESRIYLNAGEELWLSVSKNSPDNQGFFFAAHGYYVNTP